MSPQYRKVNHPPMLAITDRFSLQQYCLRCLSAWCLVMLDDLRNAVVCFQPHRLLSGKVWVLVMHLCASPMHCKVYWRMGRRLGSCRLISVQPVIGSIIRAFSMESIHCGYWRFCVVYIDRVSLKPITARYAGWLSE